MSHFCDSYCTFHQSEVSNVYSTLIQFKHLNVDNNNNENICRQLRIDTLTSKHGMKWSAVRKRTL